MKLKTYLLTSVLGVVAGAAILALSIKLERDIDGSFVQEILDTFAGVFLISPILLLLRLGRNQATQLPNGKVARMRVGPKMFSLLFFGGGAALCLLVLLKAPQEGGVEDAVGGVVIGLLAFIALHVCFLCATARAAWDQTTLVATTYLGTFREHRWEDLAEIEGNSLLLLDDTTLRFHGSGKARILRWYDGHDEIITEAWNRLNA